MVWPIQRFKVGDHMVVDDVSGEQVHRSQVRRRWDGLYTQDENWETRHPLDFVRGRAERHVPDVMRQDNVDSPEFEENPNIGAADLPSGNGT